MAIMNEAMVKLHDDEIVEASLKGSSIHAFGFPRNKRNYPLFKDTLSQKVGVYMLIGRNKPPSAKLDVYIGHAMNLVNRLSTHRSQQMINNGNWFETVVIYDSKGDMTVKNAVAVEGSLIGVCKQNSRWKTANTKGATNDASNEEKYVVDTIEKSIILTRILGWDVFRDFRGGSTKQKPEADADSEISSNQSVVFRYCGGSFLAYMKVSKSGNIIVQEGSEANMFTTDSTSDYLKSVRRKLIKTGVLIQKGDKLVFSRDYEFPKPSSAGSVIAGYGVNGNAIWQLSDGTKFGDWKKEN